MFLGNDQGGEDAHQVIGCAVRGVEAVGGDFQGLPLSKPLGVAGVKDQLGDPLAEGALSHGDARAVVTDGPGEELRAAGGVGAQKEDGGLIRQVGVLGPQGGIGQVFLPVLEVEHDPSAGEAPRGQGGGPVRSAGVAPQVHQPDSGLLIQLGHGLLEGGGGAFAEAEAVDIGDAVPQLEGDDGDVHRPAHHGPLQPLPLPLHGDGDLSPRLPADDRPGVHRGGEGLPVDLNQPVPRLKPRLQRGGAGQNGHDAEAVIKGVFDRHPDAHHHLTVDRLHKAGVVAGVHIDGVRVVQPGQNLLQGVQLQQLLGHAVHIVQGQQAFRGLQVQGPGGQDGAGEEQAQGQYAGNQFFHGSSFGHMGPRRTPQKRRPACGC